MLMRISMVVLSIEMIYSVVCMIYFGWKDLDGQIQEQEKTYTGSITLGGTTPSYDLETEINSFL